MNIISRDPRATRVKDAYQRSLSLMLTHLLNTLPELAIHVQLSAIPNYYTPLNAHSAAAPDHCLAQNVSDPGPFSP